MYDAGPEASSYSRQVWTDGEEPVDQGAGRMSRPWMHRQPRWLVYHQQVPVLEYDEERHFLGFELERLGLGNSDDEPIAGTQPLAGLRERAVNQHVSFVYQAPDTGPVNTQPLLGQKEVQSACFGRRPNLTGGQYRPR